MGADAYNHALQFSREDGPPLEGESNRINYILPSMLGEEEGTSNGKGEGTGSRSELVLDSTLDCCRLLCVLLQSLDAGFLSNPFLCSSILNHRVVINRVCSLLRSECVAVQSSAFQFLTTLYPTFPHEFIPHSSGWCQLEKGLKHATVPLSWDSKSWDDDVQVDGNEQDDTNAEQDEWCRNLSSLLHVIADHDRSSLPLVADLTLRVIKLSKPHKAIPKTSLYVLLTGTFAKSPRLVGTRAAQIFNLLEAEDTSKPEFKALILCISYYLQSFEDKRIVQNAFRIQAKAALGNSTNDGEAGPGGASGPGQSRKRRRLSSYGTDDVPLELMESSLYFVVQRIILLLSGQSRAVIKTGSEHILLEVQSELVQTIAPIVPAIAAKSALDLIQSPAHWSRNNMEANLVLLTSGLYAVTVFYDELSTPTSAQDQEDEQTISTHPRLKDIAQHAGKVFVSSVRRESSGGAPSMTAALLLAHLQPKLHLDMHDINDTVMTVFDGARGGDNETQQTRHFLSPVATLLFCRSENASFWKGFLLRMASTSRDGNYIGAIVQGMRLVMRCGKRPTELLRTAMCSLFENKAYRVQGKCTGVYDGGEVEVEEALDCLHAPLEAMFIRSPRIQPTSEFASVVVMYLKSAIKWKTQRSNDLKPLARWLLEYTNHEDAALRSIVISQINLLSNCIGENIGNVVGRLKAMLQNGRKSRPGRGAVDALQTLVVMAHECMMVRESCLVLLVLGLDHDNPVVTACGAQYLRALASLEGSTVVELIFSMPKVIRDLGKFLINKEKRGLLFEFTEVADSSLSKLTRTLLPPLLLPEYCRQKDESSITALASMAEWTPLDLFVNHGHHAIATSFWDKPPFITDLMPLVESLTGKDFLMMARMLMPRTMSNIITKAAVAGNWGQPGPEVPMDDVQSVATILSTLFSLTIHYQENPTPIRSNDKQDESSTLDCAAAATYLANGDHITRMLKQCSDQMERLSSKGDASGMLCVVREIMIIMLLADQYVGRYVPQLLVLLNTALKPRTTSLSGRDRDSVTLQALGGWQLLVKALDKQAPLQLRSTVNQIVVAVLNFLVDDDPRTTNHEGFTTLSHVKRQRDAALEVVEAIVEACHRRFPEKIRLIPPIPLPRSLNRASSAALELLRKERCILSTGERAALLLESLKDESMAVRTTALQELRVLLSNARDWGLGIFDESHYTVEGEEGGDGRGTLTISLLDDNDHRSNRDADVLLNLRRVLLKVAEPTSASHAQQAAAAECLGMLAALDPTRIRLDPVSPPPMQSSLKDLAVDVLCTHLVRMLKTAQSLKALDSTMLAIQDLLKCPIPPNSNNTSRFWDMENDDDLQEPKAGAGTSSKAAHANTNTKHRRDTRSLNQGATRSNPSASVDANSSGLFLSLPEEVQAIVRPYLDSRYALQLPGRTISGVLYGSPYVSSFQVWLTYWLNQLVDKYVSGDAALLFKAIKPVFRFDVATAMFIAPYVIHNAVVGGGHDASAAIISEMLAVLDMGPLHPPSRDSEGLKGFESSKETVLCVQAVYTLLDVLHRWSEDAKAPQKPVSATTTTTTTSTTIGNDEGEENDREWDAVRRMLSGIPKEKVARSAAACGAHARALMHYEIALREVRGGGMNPVASLERPEFADDEVSFLLEVYSRLEEPDGLEGLIKLRMGGPTLVDRRLVAEKTGAWSEALSLYERDLQVEGSGGSSDSSSNGPGQGNRSGYLNCLLQMGHWQSMLTVVDGMSIANKNTSTNASGVAASGVAAAWRLGRWNQVESHLKATEGEFPALDSDARWELRLGRLLNTLRLETIRLDGAHHADVSACENELEHARPMPKFFVELDAARAEVMGHLSAAAMESYTRAYPHLVKLHMLQEIADVAFTFVTATNDVRNANSNRRLHSLRWGERLALMQPSLSTQAPVYALRQQLASLGGFSEVAAQCWLQNARLCRARGHFDAAGHAVLEAAARGVFGAALEQAELLYAKGEHMRAISDLQELNYRLSGVGAAEDGAAWRVTARERTEYRAQVLLRLGEWTAETGTGATDEIAELFSQAVAVRPGWDTGLFRYAAYLDRMMQDAKARQKDVQVGSAPRNGSVLRQNQTNRLDRFGGRARIQVGEDTPHLELLPEVLKLYGKSVNAGRRHIYRSLPRLLTLWYEFGSNLMAAAAPDSSTRSDAAMPDEEKVVKEVMSLMKGFSVSIPMDAWLTVLPQLISRICHPHPEVAKLTKQIVTRVAQTYPQHAAWALAAVLKSTIAGRRSAATSIVSAAKRGSENIKIIFTAMTNLTAELTKLCFHQTKARQLSARRDVHLLVNAFVCPVMIPIMTALNCAHAEYRDRDDLRERGEGGGSRANVDSESLVILAGILDHVGVMPSLQSPKRVVFLGSDGKEYPFLAKPKDDLRKDARMMEAAGVLNITFMEDADARRRQLYLRRFAVLPVAEDCGLVEWVPHTKSFRTCINELVQSANVKNMQKTILASYERYKAGHQAGGLQAWLEATLRTWPPRFHRWFLSTWHEPAAWLQARLGFTRTYAAWCMVGHMVGLGDRHGDNVLLDTMSGDAIQIDFGCLFDKGLILDIPEMVPFRLTQNVIDGFGIAGFEGVYRRACETTLRVLRKNEDTVLTIMETFVHDPLVEWARNGARSRTDGQLEAENPQAKDALTTIKGRLRGTLLGVSSRPCMALSVEGHADWLIHEAANKENLSKMYIWWQAWY